MITVAIVEDSNLFRKGLVKLMGGFKGVKLIASFESGKEFIDYIDSSGAIPNIVLLDMGMKALNGLDVTKWITEMNIETKVIILSNLNKFVYISSAFGLGARAYLSKNIELKELEKAIQEVNTKGYYLNDNLSTNEIKKILENGNLTVPKPTYTPLTEREKSVVFLMCKGLSNKQIAYKLNITISAVQEYKTRAKNRLGLTNTADLLLYGFSMNLL